MTGRPSRMTPELDAVFREQAELQLRRKSLKELSDLTGFAPSHCWNQIQRHLRDTVKVSVSRETKSVETSKS